MIDKKHWKAKYIKILMSMDLKNLVGCVVGVGNGDFIHVLFDNLDIKMLYLIDPYVTMKFRDNSGIHDDYVKFREDALGVMEGYRGRVVFLEDWAQNVADSVPGGLDFVWVDALGVTRNNLEIFRCFYPKVRKGGVFSGKYYTNSWPNFKTCLHVFEKEVGIVFDKADKPGELNYGDWWIVK